jgi:hypothetical protein
MEKIEFIASKLLTAKDKQEAAKKTGLTLRTIQYIAKNKRASPMSIRLLCKHFKWSAK